jgi:hypothetical protein
LDIWLDWIVIEGRSLGRRTSKKVINTSLLRSSSDWAELNKRLDFKWKTVGLVSGLGALCKNLVVPKDLRN